ncbi:MAG: carboxypeptidase-like regulatory domain-containing protein [Chitinophagaceae bacterium]|nr:carboxypeptidase-like regulatory domain-containing protein [Chitinophagaceae bacterium]
MRKLISLSIISFFSIATYSQKIKGVVTDINGKLLPFASVFIKENNKGTNANTEGKYSLKLEPGQYTLVCQYVGYKKDERKISLAKDEDLEINFVLALQEMTLDEVIVKNGEDPAYQIIRNTIKKKNYYQSQLERFQCEVYTKGQMRVRNYPNKFFGRKVDFEDGDTSKQKMLYLSETISRYSVDKPNKEKIEVISSKVSGQSDGFGLSAPRFFLFTVTMFLSVKI